MDFPDWFKDIFLVTKNVSVKIRKIFAHEILNKRLE